MNEVNDAYIKERFGKDLPQKNVDNLRTAIQKYGENHWWESEELLQVAMYQIFEDVLMVDFSLYHQGLEKLVGRPVFTHEFALNVEGLREEARLGIERLKKGIGTSDEYKETAVRKSIEMLEDYCRKTGKKFLGIALSQKPNDRDESGNDISGYDGWLNSR